MRFHRVAVLWVLFLAFTVFSDGSPSWADGAETGQALKEALEGSPSRVVLELSDRSRIHGNLKVTSFSMRTGFGVVAVPAEQITRISFHRQGGAVSVQMKNKDTLSGTLEDKVLPIETIFGDASITVDKIAWVSFDSTPASIPISKEGLVAYYPFNGNAEDESANANDGEVHGATLTEDRFGNGDSAYRFDGANSYIRMKRSPSLNIGGQFTISAWFNTRDGENQQPIVEWNDGLYGLHMWINVPNWPGMGANIIDLNRGNHVISVGTHPEAGRWHHLAVTYDEETGTARVFFNGALKRTGTLARFSPHTYGDLFIGTRHGLACFNGALDDVMIFSRALSEDEIRNLGNP